MKFTKSGLPGVILIEPDVFRDPRGFFLETYHRQKYEQGGVPDTFVQDNHSRSMRGTVRGLHMQIRRPQGKLIRVLQGEIYDVAVDLRRGSPTFKKWEAFTLSADNFRQLYVPPGYAHGFAVTSEIAEVEYKCTEFYDPGGELGVRWNDAELGIPWPVDKPILSAKDAALPLLRDAMDRLPGIEAFAR
jgi:dTDP-4-dehydrorhamnose 3,5-epimerase